MITLNTIIEQTTTLNLSGFKESLLFQSNNVNYSSLSFEERLYHLFEAEIIQRDNKRIKRLLQAATLKDKTASLEQIEYLPKRNLDKSVIMSLSTGDFIKNNQNVLITGPTGVGKSFTMQCLARRAIDLGYTTKYYRVSNLLEDIRISRMDGTYTKTLAKISKFKLLLLDDFGVTPLKPDEINDLFEIIEDRTFNGSIIITAQLPIKDWYSYLGNETIADAMMDRLIHTSHKLELKGGSMREYLAKK
ncbi:IS21-like element helper ATPase IstB [Aliarcobacter butzleri]|uniref:IS21-like element helper ATPase IstB n=1 Tax=Aliarcobacter butzleri TaxID=28197 RepID=UPI00125EAB02|nr:IS21-like element helper ATPase IstB [Aliarcobacter butzleri]MCT7604857.1 IS21-like element helper ATPase IstB [Aliarcobacter butzleri]